MTSQSILELELAAITVGQQTDVKVGWWENVWKYQTPTVYPGCWSEPCNKKIVSAVDFCSSYTALLKLECMKIWTVFNQTLTWLKSWVRSSLSTLIRPDADVWKRISLLSPVVKTRWPLSDSIRGLQGPTPKFHQQTLGWYSQRNY